MNWKSLMADLKAASLSHSQIAAECDCAAGTLADLANGDTQQPRYELGIKLIAIHRKVMRKKQAQEKAGVQ